VVEAAGFFLLLARLVLVVLAVVVQVMLQQQLRLLELLTQGEAAAEVEMVAQAALAAAVLSLLNT
jgi:hypothetical protein